jgi:hypothetical protein
MMPSRASRISFANVYFSSPAYRDIPGITLILEALLPIASPGSETAKKLDSLWHTAQQTRCGGP